MEIKCLKCKNSDNILMCENEDDTISCWCIKCENTFTTFINDNLSTNKE